MGAWASPGTAADCTIERYGADVAEVMKALALPPTVLVGHSMGCRVVIEAALQAPAIDGSQFAPTMEAVSNAAVVASVVERAERLPKLLLDMLRYDVGRLSTSLADLRVPVMALQTTYSNERRARRLMSEGQTTPYLEMLRARIPSVRIEIIEGTGHFPQVDESAQTNALLDSFLATLHAS